jgi:hypothetical protein
MWLARDQVDSAISRAITLNEAYKEAQQRKAAVQSEEGKMERLRKDAPDLAALVWRGPDDVAEAITMACSETEPTIRNEKSAFPGTRKISSAKTSAISVLEIPNFNRKHIALRALFCIIP